MFYILVYVLDLTFYESANEIKIESTFTHSNLSTLYLEPVLTSYAQLLAS